MKKSSAVLRIASSRPFVGCDGEGVNRLNANGERAHEYCYFRMGARELYRGGRRLTSGELLTFILAAPSPRYPNGTACARTPIYVGYYFNYDATLILRDLSPSILARVFSRDPNRRRWTSFQIAGVRFAVEYRPGHYFSVRRPGVKFSTRTIVDVAANFQRSFLAALKLYDIDREHWPMIEAMKAERGNFGAITDEIAVYCHRECDDLAELMTEFRAERLAVGVTCQQYDGPGSIAASWFREEKMSKFSKLETSIPVAAVLYAHNAYYGGRFETSRRGKIVGDVHEYDINSAYPAGLLACPCLACGQWRAAEPKMLPALLADPSKLYLAKVEFRHRQPLRGQAALWFGLPFRSPQGSLSWPLAGRGVYWSVELRSAMALGATLKAVETIQVFTPGCDHRPFAWLADKYQARLALGKDRRGYPLKLGVNAVYGKCAQRVGDAPWRNPFYAGLATAHTRAALNLAIAQCPESVVMVATDALYSLAVLDLPTSRALGDWEHRLFSSLFIVQPGFYWPPEPEIEAEWKLKTRGVSRKFFSDKIDQFEAAWAAYLAEPDALARVRAEPAVTVDLTYFIGHRLAIARGRPDLAGRWLTEPKTLRWSYAQKRRLGAIDGEAEILTPLPGNPQRESLYYTQDCQWRSQMIDERDREALLFDAMPDYVDRGAPVD